MIPIQHVFHTVLARPVPTNQVFLNVCLFHTDKADICSRIRLSLNTHGHPARSRQCVIHSHMSHSHRQSVRSRIAAKGLARSSKLPARKVTMSVGTTDFLLAEWELRDFQGPPDLTCTNMSFVWFHVDIDADTLTVCFLTALCACILSALIISSFSLALLATSIFCCHPPRCSCFFNKQMFVIAKIGL